MNTDKTYAEALASEYSPKEKSKVVALRKLDRKAKRPAIIFAYSTGIIFTLLLGVGMCFSLGVLGEGKTIIGIIVGIVALICLGLNYPIYNKILESRKKKYSFEIIELAKDIAKES